MQVQQISQNLTPCSKSEPKLLNSDYGAYRHVSKLSMKKREIEKTGQVKKKGKDNIPSLLYTESDEKKEENQNPKRGNQLKRGSLTCLLLLLHNSNLLSENLSGRTPVE